MKLEGKTAELKRRNLLMMKEIYCNVDEYDLIGLANLVDCNFKVQSLSVPQNNYGLWAAAMVREFVHMLPRDIMEEQWAARKQKFYATKAQEIGSEVENDTGEEHFSGRNTYRSRLDSTNSWTEEVDKEEKMNNERKIEFDQKGNKILSIECKNFGGAIPKSVPKLVEVKYGEGVPLFDSKNKGKIFSIGESNVVEDKAVRVNVDQVKNTLMNNCLEPIVEKLKRENNGKGEKDEVKQVLNLALRGMRPKDT